MKKIKIIATSEKILVFKESPVIIISNNPDDIIKSKGLTKLELKLASQALISAFGKNAKLYEVINTLKGE